MNESDCNANCYGDYCLLDSHCIWDGKTCQNPKCSQLTTYSSCNIFPNCYIYNNKCTDRISCSVIEYSLADY